MWPLSSREVWGGGKGLSDRATNKRTFFAAPLKRILTKKSRIKRTIQREKRKVGKKKIILIDK